MIVSGTSNRSNSQWLQACVLLFAIVVLPLGVAYAQDYEAVERRLGEGVSEGELSLGQAIVMMDALRGAAKDGKDEDDVERRVGEWIGSVGEKIKAAVAAGKLSEEDAWKKWHHFKENEVGPKLKALVASGEVTERWALSLWDGLEKAEIGERLKAAVAKGEITEEQALAKWKAITEGRDKGGHDLEATWKKLQAMVKAGKLTERQAHAKMAAIKNQAAWGPSARGGKPGEERKRNPREDYARAEAELRKAVAAGRISAEDARARLQRMRKAMAGQGDRGEKVDWDPIKRRIEGAVKAGKMTREEANRHYEGLKKRFGAAKASEAELAAVKKKIWAGVKAGKMTEAQARARWEAYLKSIGR